MLEHQLEVEIEKRTVEEEGRKTEVGRRKEAEATLDSLVQAQMALATAYKRRTGDTQEGVRSQY